ncbi:MAG: hydrogenase large subunit [Polyangiales bacterium]
MTAGPLRVWETSGLEASEAHEWRRRVEERLRAGARPVTLYGRPEGDSVLATCVLQESDGSLEVLRGSLQRDTGFHTLTSEYPAMHCFERELHEQHGVRVAGHPWLKPIRFERGDRAERDRYPFYSIDGKEVHEVAVGPIHAGVIEPGAFRFMCFGEVVHHLEIHLGYQHRGVEALLLRRDPRKLVQLVETIAGDSSIAHAWAYSAAIEALVSFDPDTTLELSRGVMLELERVAMHLATVTGIAADVGFLQGASTYGRLRTTAINTSMRLCGSRFGRGAVRPCGSGVGLDGLAGMHSGRTGSITLAELRKNLRLLAEDLPIIDECFLDARTVQQRLQEVGTVTEATAREIGLVGLAARACGVPIDQRARANGAFAEPPVEITTETTGDCWARARIRITEIRRSLEWIDAALEKRADFRPSRRAPSELQPRRLAVSMTEGFRGEVVHCLETNERGELVHYKVQDPSLRNWLGLALAVRENEISDFPICNKSFDLSYCGNDL